MELRWWVVLLISGPIAFFIFLPIFHKSPLITPNCFDLVAGNTLIGHDLGQLPNPHGAHTSDVFSETTIIGTVADSPTQAPPIIFLNTAECLGLEFNSDEWHTIDLTNVVPPDTKSVDLHIFNIITGPREYNTICNLETYWVVAGSTESNYFYAGQVITSQFGDGIRDVQLLSVPVRQGEFNFAWKKSTIGDVCYYGINVRVVRYYR